MKNTSLTDKKLYELYPEFYKPANRTRIENIFLGDPPAVFSPILHTSMFKPILSNNAHLSLEVTATGVPSYTNGELYVLFSVIDKTSLYLKISEYKKVKDLALEEIKQRKKTEEALQEANLAKDKFFSIIAHDIRNPLGVFLSVSSLLISEIDTMERNDLLEFLEGIKNSAYNLNNLLDNLLTWARTQTGNINYNPAMNNLYDSIDNIFKLLANSARYKSIQLINNLDKEQIAYYDSNMISTVFRNLVTNAIKFSLPEDTIAISAIDKGDNFDICVSDSGVGMSPSDLEKLFRIDVSHTTIGTGKEKGTGLGLILCKEFLNYHDSPLIVKSELGKGSSFRFSLKKTNTE